MNNQKTGPMRSDHPGCVEGCTGHSSTGLRPKSMPDGSPLPDRKSVRCTKPIALATMLLAVVCMCVGADRTCARSGAAQTLPTTSAPEAAGHGKAEQGGETATTTE